jgi:hypothetical protein
MYCKLYGGTIIHRPQLEYLEPMEVCLRHQQYVFPQALTVQNQLCRRFAGVRVYEGKPANVQVYQMGCGPRRVTSRTNVAE